MKVFVVGVLLSILVLAGCPARPQPPAPSAPSVMVTPPPVAAPAPTTTSPAPAKTVAAKGDLQREDDPETWSVYRGAWFEVRYPQGFKVAPRQKSASAAGYDGVSFLSPDGKVEFYVFSPQWSGEPDWIKPLAGEEVEDQSTETRGESQAVQVTLRGPGGKYERAYVDVSNATAHTRHVFGIKYRNAAAYSDYLPLYLKFKESLQQFAD
ncbi:MAG TPA: hypothetical protein VGM19_00545 [Armatimonadota bacterium]|jgi:hypothetical protein